MTVERSEMTQKEHSWDSVTKYKGNLALFDKSEIYPGKTTAVEGLLYLVGFPTLITFRAPLNTGCLAEICESQLNL